MSNFLYPVALNVCGRRCVVVGGGPVGARKAVALAEAGAQVVVVAPDVSDDLHSLLQVEVVMEGFVPAHLRGAFLVVVATDNADVNRAVITAARAANVLVNMAARQDGESDSADAAGDFATMATVRRGDLILALTTGGAGPALSAKLKHDLSKQFGDEWGAYVDLLAQMRREAQARISNVEARTMALRRLVANDDVLTRVRRGDIAAAEAEARRCLFA